MNEETYPAIAVIEALSTGDMVVEIVGEVNRFSGIHLSPGECHDIPVTLRIRGVEKV